jgi:hypothetical protein
MTEHRFQDIWKQQCVAARGIRVQHGILSALDYLIGEKLLTYADTAVTKPEFARELPRFVAEVRDIFSGEEIRHYLDHLERMAVIEDEQATEAPAVFVIFLGMFLTGFGSSYYHWDPSDGTLF